MYKVDEKIIYASWSSLKYELKLDEVAIGPYDYKNSLAIARSCLVFT